MELSDQRFDRLPKWARERITQLESERWYWQGKATAGPADSDTFLCGPGLGNDDTPLGRGPTVRFVLGEAVSVWRNSIEARVTKEGRLLLMGADGVAVYPQSSNVVELELRR